MKRAIIFLLIPLFSLLACSGGGGGDGSGSGKSSDRGLRLLHAALELSPVDVYSSLNPSTVVIRGGFGNEAQYASVPDGEQSLTITRATRPDNLLSQLTGTFSSGGRNSILITGGSGFPVEFQSISDDPPQLDNDHAFVKVVHGLIGAHSLQLKIDTTSGPSTTFNSASEYFSFRPGVHTLTLLRSGDGRAVFQGSLDAQAGHSYTVFAAGDVGYFSQVKVLEH